MKNTIAFWACLGISQVWFASDAKGRESETERELRITRERLAAVEAANLVLVNAMNGRAVA